VGTTAVVLAVSVIAVLVGVGAQLLWLRHRGVTVPVPRAAIATAVVLAVVVASTLFADRLATVESVLAPLAALAIGVLSWYAFRSWRQTGWSPVTRRIAYSVAFAIATLAATLLWR
jgi:hypothetical protein